VGFRVLEIEIPSAADSKDGTSLIFRKQELLEFSVCNVPANPFALQMKSEERKNGKIAEKNERVDNANHFWDCVINNLQE
jgi:phage head maturation protease